MHLIMGKEKAIEPRLATIAIVVPRGNPTWFLKMRTDLGLDLA